MNAMKSDESDGPDAGASYQKLSPGWRIFAVVAGAVSMLIAFVLLMAALGGIFTLLAWPLHAWLALDWLPAFGVIVALFFAAGSLLAYYRITTLLEETGRASATVIGFLNALLRGKIILEQDDTGCDCRTDDDADSDGSSAEERARHKIIQFDPTARGGGNPGRRKK